jgi:hypothetical protein
MLQAAVAGQVGATLSVVFTIATDCSCQQWPVRGLAGSNQARLLLVLLILHGQHSCEAEGRELVAITLVELHSIESVAWMSQQVVHLFANTNSLEALRKHLMFEPCIAQQ